MYASASQFDAGRCADPAATLSLVPGSLRARSEVRVRLAPTARGTSAVGLYETGGLRLRFPRAGHACEGVFVNTSGGVAGGDASRITCRLERGARATLTTQSAEKIYRAEGEPAEIRIEVNLGDKATLAWLPQETILFDRARLVRTLDVEMAETASLTVLEILVFGRIARGERLTAGLFRDRWRIRRQGRLVLAEDIRLDGDISKILARKATGNGARAIASLIHVAPNAERRLASARRLLAHARSECGASAWNGLLVQRFVGAEPADVRTDAIAAVDRLSAAPLPRVWAC